MIVVVVLAVFLLIYAPVRRRGRAVQRVARASNTVDIAVVLDVAAASLMSGNSVPAMLHSVSEALGDLRVGGEASTASELATVANMLVMGAPWEEAWEQVAGFELLARTLEPAWVDGVAPVPLLVRAAHTLRITQVRRAKEAAERMGAKLVLPLGLCFLPAFVILGVVPVVIGAISAVW